MKGVGDSKSKKQTIHPRRFLPATRGIPGERSAFASIVYQVFKTVSNQGNIEFIHGLPLSEETKEKILGFNLTPQTR
jgi:hypothetical protein